MSSPDWWEAAVSEADSHLETFVGKVARKLSEPPLKVLQRKNPYLYRIRNASNPHDFAQMVLDSYLSSSEETMFGNVLEAVVVAICRHARGGRKSTTQNIDLEYDVGTMRILIQVKSAIHWGNSSQKTALVNHFQRATRILLQGNSSLQVKCIEGICYGKNQTDHRGTHYRLVGQDFWTEISAWNGTARSVMDLIGKHASNGLDDQRSNAIGRMIHFLDQKGAIKHGEIDWNRIFDLAMDDDNLKLQELGLIE